MSAPIVALGELLWDLLPEGPRAGGAPFNFAFHCHQLGHPAVIVSRVGDDELGHRLRAEVRRLGLSDEFIATDPDHPTGTVQVQVDPAGQPTYTITEHVAWDFTEWDPRLDGLARSARAICFGTLAQRRPISRNTIREFLKQAAPECVRVCDVNLRPPFDADDVLRAAIREADWLKLNNGEIGPLLRVAPSLTDLLLGSDGRAAVSIALGSDHPWQLVCVTCGADGAVVFDHDRSLVVPGVAVKVVDTVGAGDAFTAALLTQHLEERPLRQAAEFANAYAAVVASKAGGTPAVTRAEAEGLL